MAADEGSSGSPELARWYDLDTADHDEDLPLYVALADRTAEDDGVLELAVGSGRIAVPLAAAGRRVTGVDRDTHMLARARAAWEGRADRASSSGSLTLVEGDMAALSMEQKFGLVILAFSSLLLEGRQRQAACLRVMAAHLAPAGRAAIDIWLPSPDDLATYDGRLVLDWLRTDPESGRQVAKLTSPRYDAATMTARLTTFFDTWPVGGGPPTRVAREDELHLLGASELLRLVADAGMRVEQAGGDYGLTEFGPGSDRIVLVCSLL